MTPEELRAARKKLGLSQPKLYKAAGLGRSTNDHVCGMFISRMECGARPISKATAERVTALMERETK